MGRQRSRHEADGRQHRRRPQEAGGPGSARQHDRRLHHRQRGRGDQLPRWRRHAVQGAEGRGLGRRLPCTHGRSLARPHQARHGAQSAVCRARLGSHAGRHRRRSEGQRTERSDRGGQYPGIVKTTLDGVDQRDYLEGTSTTSARDFFFYFSGATPSAVRYKNWKMYYNMSQPGPDGWIMPLVPFHFTLVQNIKRDPFEQAVGIEQKTAMSIGGALGGPLTAFQYDWNMLPIGQQLWEKQLAVVRKVPAAAGARDLQPHRDPGRDEEGNHAQRIALATPEDDEGGRLGNGRPFRSSRPCHPQGPDHVIFRFRSRKPALHARRACGAASAAHAVRHYHGTSADHTARLLERRAGEAGNSRLRESDNRPRERQLRAARGAHRHVRSGRHSMGGASALWTGFLCAGSRARIGPEASGVEIARAVQGRARQRSGGHGTLLGARLGRTHLCHACRHEPGGIPGDRRKVAGDGEASAIQAALTPSWSISR